jgi:hypothetical protein
MFGIDCRMRDIKIAKWRLYLGMFIGLWSFLVASDFILTARATGQPIWGKVLREAEIPAVVMLIMYFINKDERAD